MADAFLVRLGREELVYILRAMGIATIPGLPAPPLGTLDAEQQGLALAVADRALRARGIVQGGHNLERTLDPKIAEILRQCSMPRQTVIMEVQGTEQSLISLFMMFTATLAIEHNLSEAGIHQFLAMGTAADVVDTLSRHLPTFTQQPVTDVTALITRQALQSLQANGANIATQTSLPAEIAQAVATPQTRINLARWEGTPSSKAPGYTLTFLQSTAGLWQYSMDEEWVEIRPTTPTEMGAILAAFLRPALDLLPQSA